MTKGQKRFDSTKKRPAWVREQEAKKKAEIEYNTPKTLPRDTFDIRGTNPLNYSRSLRSTVPLKSPPPRGK